MSAEERALVETLLNEFRTGFKLITESIRKTHSTLHDLDETVCCKMNLLSAKIDLVSCFTPAPNSDDLKMRVDLLEKRVEMLEKTRSS